MAKCSKGHYTPYEKVSRRQARCEHCNDVLWAGTVQPDRVILWQGQEYAANDEAMMPVPAMIEVFYDFNGTERPKPPIPPKGRRRRRYMNARNRWSDIQWRVHYARVGEDIACQHEKWLREECDAT